MTTSIIVSKIDAGYSVRSVAPNEGHRCAIAGHSPDAIDAAAALATYYVLAYGVTGRGGWSLIAQPEVMRLIPESYRTDPVSIFPGELQ